MILWKPLREHSMGAAVMYKGKQKKIKKSGDIYI